MMEFTTRTLFPESSSLDLPRNIGDRDLEAIGEMLRECEEVDRLDDPISLSDLRQQFNAPLADGIHDVMLWENADGQLVAIAQFSIPELPASQDSPKALERDGKTENAIDSSLWFRVRPSARNQGVARPGKVSLRTVADAERQEIEEQIIEWGEGQLREIAGKFNASAQLRSAARDDQTERINWLSTKGFVPLRYFYRMKRSLIEPFPKPQLPPGFVIVLPPGTEIASQKSGLQLSPFAGGNLQKYLEASVEMVNQSFIDHWNFHDLTIEEIEYEFKDPNYRPELDLVAVAADSTFAAFCYCYISPGDNERSGCQEGWVCALGTRRGFRKQGLGRAMLLAGMEQLKAAGMEKAVLEVDAENPSGAMGFYESVGFSKFRTDVVYVKQL